MQLIKCKVNVLSDSKGLIPVYTIKSTKRKNFYWGEHTPTHPDPKVLQKMQPDPDASLIWSGLGKVSKLEGVGAL